MSLVRPWYDQFMPKTWQPTPIINVPSVWPDPYGLPKLGRIEISYGDGPTREEYEELKRRVEQLEQRPKPVLRAEDV